MRTSETLDGDFIITDYSGTGVCVRDGQRGSLGSHGFLYLGSPEFECHSEGWHLPNGECKILIGRPVVA